MPEQNLDEIGLYEEVKQEKDEELEKALLLQQIKERALTNANEVDLAKP